MKMDLSPVEGRIIGSLIEKQITTPDQYPLSLNALVNACNQKSNRDPVMDLEEATVQSTLDGLARKHLVMERSGFGSRVPKYQHRFCNTEFGVLKFDPQELAIVCELLLRGPQTPGELRTRASRMASFTDVTEAEAALARLTDRPDGPFVTRLAREPGRRESRFAHLFGAAPPAGVAAAVETPAASGASAAAAVTDDDDPDRTAVLAPELAFPASRNDQRLAQLEEDVKTLRAELDELKRRLGG